MINQLLYDDYSLHIIKWKYGVDDKKSLDKTVDIILSESNLVSAIDDNNIDLDSFNKILNKYAEYVPTDTLHISKCKKGDVYVLDKTRRLAIWMQLKYNIPHSFTQAQIVLETAWGTSVAFEKSNQCFGTKCFINKGSHWKVHKHALDSMFLKAGHQRVVQYAKHCNYYKDDRKYNRFINYDSYLHCGIDRYKHINTSYNRELKKLRYKHLLSTKIDKNAYKIWTEGIHKGGWATDKKYATKLNTIIEYNNLNAIDVRIEEYRTELLNVSQLYFDKKMALYEISVKRIINTNNLK
jgi:hypothetical protein